MSRMTRFSRRSGSGWVTLGLLLIFACTARVSAESITVPAVKGQLTSVGQGADIIHVLKVWGTPYEMGYAHGKLCATQIRAFYTRLITAMALGMGVNVSVLDEAWAQMEPFVKDRYKQEMRGLADGSGIDLKMIQRAHAIPDLSEFHCTFFAAWGKATPDGSLQQIRALDYETRAGIQDEPALIVQIPDDANAFVNVAWLGFIGVVTGMNEKKIALSEIGDHFGDDVETLAGEPLPFLMRRVLEEADSLDQAVKLFQTANRTSSLLYCIGDAKIPSAVKLRTSAAFCEVYTAADGDRTLPDVVYWSMGADSVKWNTKVYEVLKGKHGSIDPQVGMIDVMRNLETGDLHAVHFDVAGLELWVGNATPAPENAPGYDQTYVHFSFADALGWPRE